MKNMAKTLATALLAPLMAGASVWSGGNGNWSSDGTPGWNGTGVPDGQGAVAEFTTSGTTTVDDPGGVTVGVISYMLPGGADRAFAGGGNPYPIILDYDGSGPGMAVISNSTASRLIFNNTFSTSGVYAYDDLKLVNSGAGAGSYSISFTTILRASGNVYIDNISTTPLVAPVYFQGTQNTFGGNIHVLRGTVSSQGASIGNANNTVFLGSAGNGAASLIATASASTFANPFVISAGTGGEIILGASYTGSGQTRFSGALTLEGDLSVSSLHSSPGLVRLEGVIGVFGALTKIGAGDVRLEKANTYTGGTIIAEGALIAANASALGTGPLDIKEGAVLQLDASVAVDSLFLNGKPQPPGTFGATDSGAQHVNDECFTGHGVLTALNGVPVGTLLFLK